MGRTTSQCIVLAAIALACGPDPDSDLHLLPTGFEGEVVIIYGAPDGELPEWHDERRVYRIPASGILRTQFESHSGWLKAEYYFVDPSGTLGDEITGRSYGPILDTPENRVNQELGVLNTADGVAAPRIPGTGKYSATGPCAVKYAKYFVGQRDQFLDRRHFDVPKYLKQNPVPCDEDEPSSEPEEIGTEHPATDDVPAIMPSEPIDLPQLPPFESETIDPSP